MRLVSKREQDGCCLAPSLELSLDLVMIFGLALDLVLDLCVCLGVVFILVVGLERALLFDPWSCVFLLVWFLS